MFAVLKKMVIVMGLLLGFAYAYIDALPPVDAGAMQYAQNSYNTNNKDLIKTIDELITFLHGSGDSEDKKLQYRQAYFALTGKLEKNTTDEINKAQADNAAYRKQHNQDNNDLVDKARALTQPLDTIRKAKIYLIEQLAICGSKC